MSRFDWLELAPEKPQPHLDAAEKLSGPPTDSGSYYHAARRLREAGHFKSATEYYQRAVGLDAGNFSAACELIDTLVRAGLKKEADTFSAEAYENYRRVPLFYASRGLVLAHLGRLQEAWDLCQTAFDHTDHWYPRFVWTELQLRASSENVREFACNFDELVARNASLWELPFLCAWVLLEAQCPAHAAGFAAEAAHLKPRAAASWIALGDAFFALRLYDQAVFYYQRTIELEATHPLALERLRRASGLRYGLMRLFSIGDLRRRWTKCVDRETNQH